MGKIVVSENVSLDGVVQDPAGDEGFRHGGWVGRITDRPEVGKLARRITEQRSRVEAALHHSLSNARVEQANTQIRLIIRRGFGYHSAEAVIALAMLSLGGLCPPLPGR